MLNCKYCIYDRMQQTNLQKTQRRRWVILADILPQTMYAVTVVIQIMMHVSTALPGGSNVVGAPKLVTSLIFVKNFQNQTLHVPHLILLQQ